MAVFFFSGTGNSRRVARDVAARLGLGVPRALGAAGCAGAGCAGVLDGDLTVLVCPVYGWRVPCVVEDWVGGLPLSGGWLWVVLTCGDDVGFADVLLSRALGRRGWRLAGCFSIGMRNTYVGLPGFDVDSLAVVRRKELAYAARVGEICGEICTKLEGVKTKLEEGKTKLEEGKTKLEEGSTKFVDGGAGSPVVCDVVRGRCAWLKTFVLGWAFRRFLMSPRRWWVRDEVCSGCGACVRTCPLGNVRLDDGSRPVWGGRCTACFGCFHACRRGAVQYGRWTRGKGRVVVSD